MGKISEIVQSVKENEQNPEKMKLKEYYSYALAQFGYSNMGVMNGGYLLQFYNAVGISPKTAGTIMAASRVWDGLNDPLIAAYIDNGRNPKGKFKPYLAKFVPILALFSFLMLTKPPVGGGNMNIIIAWCLFTYCVWEFFNTFSSISFQAMGAVMSRDTVERSNYVTIGSLGGTLSGAVPGLIPVLYDLLVKNGRLGETNYYTLCALIFCTVGGIAAMFSVNLKERVVAPPQEHFWDSFVTFAKNRQLILLWLANVPNVIAKVGWGTSAFFFMHSLGNWSYQTLIWTLTGAPGFIVQALSPVFIKRFRPSRIVIFANLLNAGCMFAMYFTASAFGYASKPGIFLIIAFTFIASIPGGVKGIASNVCSLNTYEYTEWKTSKRAEATSMVITGFLNKQVDAVGALVLGYMLEFIGFKEGEGAVQSQRTKDWLFICYIIFPAIATVLSTIPYFFFKMDGKRFTEISKELEERRNNRLAAKETAESAENEESIEI
ncbi:MAG: MFS transporter [Oscillospiraceae bacterium]|nr:MFS transporter [Oscillospiraceae bacterium]